MNTAIWLLFVQALLGAFDTLYYHEYRLRLPHAHGTGTDLRLHAARDFAYAVIIGSLGFLTWNGALAWVLCALLLAEIGITLWDFVEEDRIRRLPGGERVMHGVMGIVYGAFLAYLIPEILRWHRPTRFGPSYHGFPAWVLSGLAVGVLLSGIRDVMASVRWSSMTDHLPIYRLVLRGGWPRLPGEQPSSRFRFRCPSGRLDVATVIPLVQVIGMLVGVYAIAYYLLAREPLRYAGLIWVALAGKTLGPVGFAYHAIAGTLPWTFGWTCVLNDLIWWPVFWSFALRYAKGR